MAPAVGAASFVHIRSRTLAARFERLDRPLQDRAKAADVVGERGAGRTPLASQKGFEDRSVLTAQLAQEMAENGTLKVLTNP